MPRARGQIDTRKSDAIITAAFDVLAERGLSAPLEEVARRARVSKQTVYNHYGSKSQLIRTLIERRAAELTTTLMSDAALAQPEKTLTDYALTMIHSVLTEPYGEIMRMAISGTLDVPELAEMVYECGIIGARTVLAGYLDRLVDAGRLKIDNTQLAAEMFAGIALGGLQMRALMGRSLKRDLAAESQRAEVAAQTFLRAYST